MQQLKFLIEKKDQLLTILREWKSINYNKTDLLINRVLKTFEVALKLFLDTLQEICIKKFHSDTKTIDANNFNMLRIAHKNSMIESRTLIIKVIKFHTELKDAYLVDVPIRDLQDNIDILINAINYLEYFDQQYNNHL